MTTQCTREPSPKQFADPFRDPVEKGDIWAIACRLIGFQRASAGDDDGHDLRLVVVGDLRWANRSVPAAIDERQSRQGRFANLLSRSRGGLRGRELFRQ